jgi:acetyl-CoA carboxylase carboxyltransferase component
MSDYLTKLRELREKAMQGGGPERIAQQHARGKLTARERLALLLDEGSFQELGALATHNLTDFGMASQRFPGDGIVTGFGKINGRRVAVYAQDLLCLAVRSPKCNRKRFATSKTSHSKVAFHSSA